MCLIFLVWRKREANELQMQVNTRPKWSHWSSPGPSATVFQFIKPNLPRDQKVPPPLRKTEAALLQQFVFFLLYIRSQIRFCSFQMKPDELHTWNCGDWTSTFRMGKMRRAGERCTASCLPLRRRRRRGRGRRRRGLVLRRWWLLVLGGSVVKLQRLPDLPELLVDQLQSQRAVQCLRGKKNDDGGGWRVKQLLAESPFNVH